jgi:hypothetical protein
MMAVCRTTPRATNIKSLNSLHLKHMGHSSSKGLSPSRVVCSTERSTSTYYSCCQCKLLVLCISHKIALSGAVPCRPQVADSKSYTPVVQCILIQQTRVDPSWRVAAAAHAETQNQGHHPRQSLCHAGGPQQPPAAHVVPPSHLPGSHPPREHLQATNHAEHGQELHTKCVQGQLQACIKCDSCFYYCCLQKSPH